jgi:hypothetical protein
LNGLGEQRVGSEEVDLETVGDLKRSALDLRVGIRDLSEFALRVDAGNNTRKD